MPEVKIEKGKDVIRTSPQYGPDFCDFDCEHIETYTKFPPVAVCKIGGVMINQDDKGRVPRTIFCKYLCGEEVPERFWSPMK